MTSKEYDSKLKELNIRIMDALRNKDFGVFYELDHEKNVLVKYWRNLNGVP